MAFFTSAVNILQTLVVAIGAGLGVWGVINLMEGYSIEKTSHGDNSHFAAATTVRAILTALCAV